MAAAMHLPAQAALERPYVHTGALLPFALARANVLRPTQRGSGLWAALAVALVVEACLVLGIGAYVLAHPPEVPVPVVPLSIEPIPTTEPEKPPEPPPEKPPEPVKPPPVLPTPVPIAKAVQPTPPLPAQAAQAAPLTPSPAPSPEPAQAAAPAPPAPAQQAPPAPPPQPSAPAIDPAIAYNAKLAAAVQAVYQVPIAATELEFRGRTRVEFSMQGGVLGAVRVVQTSGLGAADRAAVKAVQSAAFPAPPAALQGKDGLYLIWVNCRL